MPQRSDALLPLGLRLSGRRVVVVGGGRWRFAVSVPCWLHVPTSRLCRLRLWRRWRTSPRAVIVHGDRDPQTAAALRDAALAAVEAALR